MASSSSPGKKPAAATGSGAASSSGAAVRPKVSFQEMLMGDGDKSRIHASLARFLSVEDGAALSQTSHAMRAAVGSMATGAPPITGRAMLAGTALHTTQAPGADRFYFQTALSGEQAPFPHVTRRARAELTPHVTDIQPAAHAEMPNGLAPGVYPTRHRYDHQPDGTLSAPLIPLNNGDRGTATFTSFVGAAPDTFVTPRYKARAEAGGALPALATPVKLSPSESGAGGAAPRPSWEGQPLSFQRKA